MSKGRRYNGDNTHKLNIKKVIATIIAILVIIMFIIIVVKVVNTDQKTTGKGVTLAYYTTYQDGKWGVIDQYGNTVVDPKYEFSDITKITVLGKWHSTEGINTAYFICE